MHTTDSNLAFNELLGPLRVPGSNILSSCGENFHHFRAHVALTIGETVAICWHCKEQPCLLGLLEMVRSAYSGTIAPFVSIVTIVAMVPWRSVVISMRRMVGMIMLLVGRRSVMVVVMGRVVRLPKWWKWRSS
jgi:hypothetical protein